MRLRWRRACHACRFGRAGQRAEVVRLEEEPLQQHRREDAEKHRNHEQEPQGQPALTLALPLLWIGFRLSFFMWCHRRTALICLT